MITLNGHPINTTLFPDNTTQVWKLPEALLNCETFLVKWDFATECEAMHLLQLKRLIDPFNKMCVLEIDFLPYARQDKTIGNNNTFAFYPFAEFLNFLKFNAVLIFDPHNACATKTYISNSVGYIPEKEIYEAYRKSGANIVCYPDQSAMVKYGWEMELKFVNARKVRDQGTGLITSIELSGDVAKKDVLIVDDICDGGATFIKLAKLLYENGAESVHLYVSHGLFSQGLGVLRAAEIKRIFVRGREIE